MPEASAPERITELEVEKEAILATLQELKKSYESNELNEDDYEASKKEYEAKLESIDEELTELNALLTAREKERASKAATTEYSKMPWDELRTLAKQRGISVGKGITKEMVAAELLKTESNAIADATLQADAMAVSAVPKAAPIPTLEKAPLEEKQLRLEIDPTVKAQVEMIKGEIPSLNSTLAALKMKKQVGESSLKVLKKNKDDGLIDDSTFKNLKDKYESEVSSTSAKINEITSEMSSLEKVLSKFDELSTTYSEYKNVLKKLEEEQFDMQRELDFMETGRLYIVSNLKNYLGGILENLKAVEEREVANGVAYPDAGFLENKKSAIKKDKDEVADLKTKLDNFETLIASLEKEKEEGEVDPETYSVLKNEYVKEKNRTLEKMGKIKGHLKMMETEMKGYEKLNESVEACKSFIDMTNDSFSKIWLEEEIDKKRGDIQLKNQEIKEHANELSKRLEELESEVSVLLKRTNA